MIHFHPHATRRYLRRVKDLFKVVDLAARHIVGLHGIQQFLLAHPGHLHFDLREQRLTVCDPRSIGRKCRIFSQGGCANHIAKPLKLAVITDRHKQVAIFGGKGLIGHNIRVLVAAPPGHLARLQIIGAFVDQPRDLAIHQRHINILPLAGLVPVPQGGQYRTGGIHAAHHVGNPHTHLHRGSVRLSRQAHDTAIALCHQVITRQVGIGAGLAKTSNRAINDRRVHRLDRLVIQPIFFEPAQLVVFDQNIRFGRQLFNQRRPFRC